MSTVIDAEENLLKKYKKHLFAPGLFPFSPTLKALGTAFACVSAKQEGRQRWVLVDKSTGEPAIFSHAALFARGDDIETGNFVPSKEELPAGLEEKSAYSTPSKYKMFLYMLDDYMKSVKGFNAGSLPRRSYMSGLDARFRSRFTMNTPMFLCRDSESGAVDISHLHPWVVEADNQSKLFCANPDQPRVWVKDGDKILPINECDPNVLQRGDLVAISFTVTYHVTTTNWFPQYHPVDILVLRQTQGDPTDYSSPTIDLSNRPAPELMDIKYVDSDSDDESPPKRRKTGDVEDGMSSNACKEDVIDDSKITYGGEGDIGTGEGAVVQSNSNTVASLVENERDVGVGPSKEYGISDEKIIPVEGIVDVAVKDADKLTTRTNSGKGSRLGRKRT